MSPTFGVFGGMEAFVLTIARSLASAGTFDVKVCFKRVGSCPQTLNFDAPVPSVPIETVDRASGALTAAIRWADVVHGQNASPDVAFLASVFSKPLAVSIHNVLPRRPLHRRVSWRLAARAADARWYNSRYVWRTWEPDGQWAGSECVHPTSDLPRVSPPARRQGFVFVGRLVESKGPDLLLEAYRLSGVDPKTWPLTFIGDGPLRVQLEEKIKAESLEGVSCTGFLSGDQKALRVAGARWIVVPSHWSEPYGLAADEARRLGVPCIATRDGGLPEAAGPAALLCEPGHVEELSALLRRASTMSSGEYDQVVQQATLPPTTDAERQAFYFAAYRRLASEKRKRA